MKILFLSRLYWPHVGGVEKHIARVSKSLSLRGYKVTVLTTRYHKKLKAREKKNGIEILRFRQPNIKYLGLLDTWLWLFKNRTLIQQNDIVHIHDVFIWYWPFKILYPDKKVYITFHGRWGKYPIPWIDILQKKIGAKLSKGVFCIGDYIPKNYGINADAISYGAVSTVLRSVVEKDEESIVYVGRLDKDIGLKIILQAIKRFRRLVDDNKLNVEFVGDGSLREECEKYGKVHGFTDPEPFYRKAKYCFASGYLTILEAMAHKCLVFAAYDNPLKKDYYEMTPFKDFIVIAGSSKELLRKFKYYSKNKKAAQKKINKGYNWVKGQTWEEVTDSYLKLWGKEEI